MFRPHYCKQHSHLTNRVQEKFLSQQSRGTAFTYFGRILGYAVAQLFEALRYKSEGRGFDS